MGLFLSIKKVSESAFLSACRGDPVPHTPVWFMRQAGRSLPEYRARRGSDDILEAIKNPELAAELTLQPVRRYGVDAAILFSDILAPAAAVGLGIRVLPGTGPVMEEPITATSDVSRLRPFEPEIDAPWTTEAIQILDKELRVPLIGFTGGPFTVASYLLEGRPTRDFTRTKYVMYAEGAVWDRLMRWVAETATSSLRSQVSAGAHAVQLFDTWIGALSPDDYRRYVLPTTLRVFEGIADLAVPKIYFGVGAGELLSDMSLTEVDVMGVDWRVPLPAAAARLTGIKALQGNLEPALCLAPWQVVAAGAHSVLQSVPKGIGHIFNLGHGVLPTTDPSVLQRLVDLVHLETRTV